jgi:hypothetical protein
MVRGLRGPRSGASFYEYEYSGTAYDLSVLATVLRAIDEQLCSTPRDRHHELELLKSVNFSPRLSNSAFDRLEAVLGGMQPIDKIADAFVELYTTALAGRICRSAISRESSEPTCSKVLRILPGLDEELGTSLRVHFDAVYAKGKCLIASFTMLSG